MEISQVLAQEIVTQMKKILSQEINFMNSKAIIIASTDPTRIGYFHGGADIVLRNKEPLIIREDDEYTGSRKGINMPIALEKEVIGVIGITGEQEKIEKYGEIIKKMTQILIKEDFLKEISIKRRERFQYIIWNILNYEARKMKGDTSFVLNYNYHLPHRTVVGKNFQPIDFQNEEIYQLIENKIRNHKSYMYYIRDQKLFLFTREVRRDALEKDLKCLSRSLNKVYGYSFCFGAGPVSYSISEASKGFQYALEALDWNVRKKINDVLFFEEMDMGLLLTGLERERKKLIEERIAKKIPEGEFQELKEILFAYGDFNKSISKSSEKLFIHKNTFRYKLNKIYEYTGYDPKVLNDYILLYVSFLIRDVYREKEE